jgi:hypothetical protein
MGDLKLDIDPLTHSAIGQDARAPDTFHFKHYPS